MVFGYELMDCVHFHQYSKQSFDMSPGGGGRREGGDIAGADMSPKRSVIVHYQASL